MGWDFEGLEAEQERDFGFFRDGLGLGFNWTGKFLGFSICGGIVFGFGRHCCNCESVESPPIFSSVAPSSPSVLDFYLLFQSLLRVIDYGLDCDGDKYILYFWIGIKFTLFCMRVATSGLCILA